MNYNEREYRGVITRAGIALLFFMLFFNATNIVVANVIEPFSLIVSGSVIGYIFSQVCYAAAYLFSFLMPAFIFRKISAGKVELAPMRLDFKLPKSTPIIIIAAIAVNFGVAYLNALLMTLFRSGQNVSEATSSSALPPYAIVLMFMSTALVPAFCEEFLFRGTILSNLMPYGKGGAIIGSAVLFGLMHQNSAQILYTTVSGLILGYVYVKTGSIWCGTLIHFFNNALGVTEDIIMQKKDTATAGMIITGIEIVLAVLGVLSVLYLMCGYIIKKRGGTPADNGSFGRMLETAPNYSEKAITAERRAKLFWAPPIIVFAAVSVAEMILLLFI